MDINNMDFSNEFDIIFSNAALHWILDHYFNDFIWPWFMPSKEQYKALMEPIGFSKIEIVEESFRKEVMVVIGAKEKASVEEILPECTAKLQSIYEQTQEGNGQRWLMIDLEDKESLYHDLGALSRSEKYNLKGD